MSTGDDRDLGSGVVTAGYQPLIVQVRLRLVICHVIAEAMTTCTGQQLIPDQWWISAHASANDLGSVSAVMFSHDGGAIMLS